MKNSLKIKIPLILTVLLVAVFTMASSYVVIPAVAHAAIVPQICTGGTSDGECGWTDFLKLVNNFITFLLYLTATLATLSFSYAGWLYMTSGGDSGKISQAHGIFIKVIIGFLFAFGGWLIVQLILNNIGLNTGYSLLIN